MGFRDQTAAFFDELGKIREGQQEHKEEDMGQAWKDGKGVYHGMLLENETPLDFRHSQFPEPNDPQIILRGGP